MADKELKLIISAVDNASKTLNNISDQTSKLTQSLSKIGKTMAIAGGAITGLGIAVIKQAADFERYRMSLNTLVGDGEKATKLFGDLKKFAKETPFSFEDVLQGTNQLIAMGAAVKDVIPEMRMLGDVSAGLNVPMDRLIVNFGQVRAQGKLTGRELRDFAIAGVPLLATLAKQFGKTEAEIQDMVSAGKIGFEDVKQAFMNMTSKGQGFFDMMKNLSETTAGKFEKLKDQLRETADAMGQALLPYVNKLLDVAVPLLEKFTAFTTEHPKLVAGFFAMGAAVLILGTAMVGLAIVINSVATVLPVLSAAIGGVSAAIAFLAANPIVLIIAGILLLIGFIIYLITHFDTLKQNVELVWNAIKDVIINNAQWAAEQATAIFNTLKTNLNAIWNRIKIDTDITNKEMNLNSKNVWTILMNNLRFIAEQIKTNTNTAFTTLKDNVTFLWESMKTNITTAINAAKDAVASAVNAMIGFFDKLKGAIQSVIDKFKEWVGLKGPGGGSGGGASFQHGGVVPGGAGTPVPALLHGGERVIPRTGVDANPAFSGGGVTLNLFIEGDVNSMDMVDNIVEAVKSSLGRDNELAQQGVGI